MAFDELIEGGDPRGISRTEQDLRQELVRVERNRCEQLVQLSRRWCLKRVGGSRLGRGAPRVRRHTPGEGKVRHGTRQHDNGSNEGEPFHVCGPVSTVGLLADVRSVVQSRGHAYLVGWSSTAVSVPFKGP